MLSKSRSRSGEERSNGEQSLLLLKKRGCFLRHVQRLNRDQKTPTQESTKKN